MAEGKELNWFTELPSFYCSRGLKQYYQSWIVAAFYPKCRLDRVQEFRRRARSGGQVVNSCRCGLLRIEASDGPRLITVCHCSVCRYDEAASLHKEDAPAPSFAAVRREKCKVYLTREWTGPDPPLVWRQSSEFARRARCVVCSTSLVMDYEWFEPNTIWLVRPTWTKEGGKKVDVEKAFNGGLADMDVCWNSRGDPCSANTKVSYLGEERLRERLATDHDDVTPRGRDQADDLDWTLYYLDVGRLDH